MIGRIEFLPRKLFHKNVERSTFKVMREEFFVILWVLFVQTRFPGRR